MEENKKPSKVKEFWNKHKGKVKVAVTAVAAFTVGALLATPNKEDREILKFMNEWDYNSINGNSFRKDLILASNGSTMATVFRTRAGDNHVDESDESNATKNHHNDEDAILKDRELMGAVLFTK